MKSTTFALTALASIGSAIADGWYNSTLTTTHTDLTTLTGFTTVCPESTVFTITTCRDHKCTPHVYSITEPTTLTITEECVFPTSYLTHTKILETHEKSYNTHEVTVTGYTTYCPESTVITITTCKNHVCAPHEYTVSKASSLTISEECVFPTSYYTHINTYETHEKSYIHSEVTVTGYTTYCPESTVVTITTCFEDRCAPHSYTVSEATTLTITEECVFPTSYLTHTNAYETHETTCITSGVTVSGYTTYCPEPTVVTITTCIENHCAPHAYTISEATTLIITEECVIPTVITYTQVDISRATIYATSNIVSTAVTIAGFTTYCSESTILTVTTCVEDVCAPHQIIVTEATTVSIEQPCLIATVYTTSATFTTNAVYNSQSSGAYISTPAAVSTFEGGAVKVAAGFAGFVGILALMV